VQYVIAVRSFTGSCWGLILCPTLGPSVCLSVCLFLSFCLSLTIYISMSYSVSDHVSWSAVRPNCSIVQRSRVSAVHQINAFKTYSFFHCIGAIAFGLKIVLTPIFPFVYDSKLFSDQKRVWQLSGYDISAAIHCKPLQLFVRQQSTLARLAQTSICQLKMAVAACKRRVSSKNSN